MSPNTSRILANGAQGLGCVAGVVGMVMGIWSAINLACLIGGVVLSILAFFVIVIEAPYCYMMFEFTDKLYNVSQSVPVLVKAAMYILAGIVPVLLCPLTFAVWLGAGLIAAAGVLYAVRALKRDSPEAAEPAENTELQGSKTNLVNKE